MKHLSPEQKHSIVARYRPRSPTHSFSALASQAGGGVTKSTVRNWYLRWDGMVASLKHEPVLGRPRVLSRGQVTRHVQPRIRAANRNARPIHYTDLLPVIHQATGKQMSIRTLRRYGKQELGAKQKHTVKRTTAERKQHTHIAMASSPFVLTIDSFTCCCLLFSIWKFLLLCAATSPSSVDACRG
jgi:hypothetical protein